MGQLTLNILLSFAQFERELSGERVRNKIAASRQRGDGTRAIGPPAISIDNTTIKLVARAHRWQQLLHGLYTSIEEMAAAEAINPHTSAW